MKKIVVLSFLLLMDFCASAQMEINKMERLLLDKKDSLGVPSYKFYVNLSGEYAVNSNSVTNRFLKSLLYRGDFIDNEMKDHESARLKKSNRLGAEEGIYLHGAYSAPKLTYVFGIGQRVVAGARFPSDFFELIFRGNASYAGREADLSRTNIRFFDYQSIYGGVQKELKDGKYTLGAALSLIRGGNYMEMKMNEGKLYTEPSGQYVDYHGDMSFYRYPYDSSGSFLKSHGMGAGLNLSFSMKHKKNRLNVEVRDIGVIAWKGVKHYHGENTTYRYNGVLLDDLLGDGSSIVSDITVDSVAKATGLGIDVKDRTMFLPSVIHANYVMFPNKRFTRTVGVRYMLMPGYIPQVYVRGADFLGKGFTLVNTVSYGGFGRFDYEIGLLKKFGNSFIISTNLFAFEYFVLPGKSSGHGLSVGFTKIF